jgi:hypothetical protein
MRGTWSGKIAAAGAMLALARPATAGPPMITDDPGTQPAGVWEENVALTLTRTRHQAAWQAPFVDNNYSPADDLQLTFQFAPAIVDGPDAGPVGGVAPVTLAAKYRLPYGGAGPAGLSMSVAPAYTFDTGTPALRRHLGIHGATVFLPVQVNQRLGRQLDVFAEAGYLAVQFGGDHWSYGVCADWHPDGGGLHLLAEVHAVSDTAFRTNDVVVNVGVVCPLRENLNLLLSAGRGLRDADESTRLVIYGGVQFLLK